MINLVLGRSGYGKTEYVFNKIEELLNNDEKDIFLLTPEQFSFVSERRLLERFGESGVQKIENSNFTKLFHEVTKVYGGTAKPMLSDGGRAVLMNKAIYSVQDSLKLFSKYKGSTSFVDSMLKIFDELNACNINDEILLNISETNENKILSDKIYDIYLISLAYKSLIKSDYFDPSDRLNVLYHKLVDSNYFKDRTVLIDGFSGFVALEQKILEIIIRDAKDVYVTACCDNIFDDENGYGLFSHTKNTANDIISIADKHLKSKKIIKLEEDKRHNNSDLVNIEKYLYAHNNEKFKSSNNVEVFEATTISEECDYVSRSIIELLRKDVRAKEIAVVCRDINTYQNQIISSFKKFGVPFFDDERQPLKTQPIVVFVDFLFRVIEYSFRSEDLFSLVKTGLFDLSVNDISLLENYVIIWNINGSKWFEDFAQSPKGFSSELSENDVNILKSINRTRKSIIEPILKFKFAIKDANAKKICESIYNLLIEIKADKNLKLIATNLTENGFQHLSEEQGKVWDLLMKILNQLAITIGDDFVSIKEFGTLFDCCIESEDIGIIPQGLDNVQFGQADRIRINNSKVTFLIGATEGDFPKSVISGGILTENDRRGIKLQLDEENRELYSSGQTLVVQEKYFAYMASSSPSDRLFVSYSTNVLGETKTPSYIVRRIKAIFDDVDIKTADSSNDLELIECENNGFEILANNWGNNSVFISSLKKSFESKEKYNPIIKTIELKTSNNEILIEDKHISENLFGKDMFLSASRIEEYFSCPFKYFCKFGIGAKPRKVAEMDAIRIGTLIHFVLENILKEVGSNNLWKLSVEDRHNLVVKYLTEYFDDEISGTNVVNERFSYQFMRISKMLNKVIDRLALEFSQSKFEAKAFEMKVDVDGEVHPPIIMLDDGGSIKLRGSIDRVDVFEQDNEKYVRVVDYKSGIKVFNLNDILYGLNLQMFVYLFALCSDNSNELSGTPSGVLYMHSSRAVVSSTDRREKTADIKSSEDKEYKMNGIVLDKDSVIEAMENDVNGRFIPAKLSKDQLKGDIVSLEQMGKIAKEIDKKVSEMGLNLHQGKINPYPINGKNHDRTCEFCDYQTVCMNKSIIETHEIEELSLNEVKEILEEEE